MSKDKVHLARFVLDALDGEIVDSTTEDAQTPLISSVLLPDGQTRGKFLELLLQKQATVNSQDGNGRTTLSQACEKGYLDAVRILVRNDADPEIMDSWGNTALMYAAVAGHSSIVEFMVRAFKRLGLQIDRQNKVGNSAVEVAKFLGHTACIRALTSNTKKLESDGGALEDAQPLLNLGYVDVNDKFQRKAGHLVTKREVLHACNHADYQPVQTCTWKTRPRLKQSLLPWMDSMEECERENNGSSVPSQELVFSGVLTSTPPPRTSDNSPKHPKAVERLTTCDDHLPPLARGCEAQRSNFFSPWSNKNTPKPTASSALGLLLTPILAYKGENDSGTEK
uniref:Uncharacterized protein n=1 Tax=Monopterus albus TaxID=43700 RepID=A0A3Q3JXK3_MONAL